MKILKQKRINIILFILLFLVALTFLFVRNKQAPENKVHYHAGFIVFKDNKQIDFSDSKYMNITPCTTDKSLSDNNPQLEKAHLHDNVGTVVHIEHSQAIWKDLFTNIHFPIDYSDTVGYINGTKVDNYSSYSIHPDDSLVVFIGKNDITTDLKHAMTKNEIETLAKKSISCGD